MTQTDILQTIQSLPKEQQFALATSILDRLASEGALPVSDDLKAEFQRREEIFDEDQSQGEPWDQVKSELFDQ
jgi:putative addiction module component (TIGR02574 family)